MNSYVILVAIAPVICVTWDTGQIVTLARELATKRFVPCVGIVHPMHPNQSQPEALAIAKLLRQDFYIRILPLEIPSGRPIWEGCATSMYVLLSWLPKAQQEFPQFLDIARGPMLTFLSPNTTIEEFIGKKAIPLEAQPIFPVKSRNGIIITQAYRIFEGHALQVVPYAEWTPAAGLQCVYTYCDFFTFYDLEGMVIRATTKPDPPICDLVIRNNTLKITGYFGAVFYDLAKQLNFQPVIVPATENRTGSIENGSWNGLIGMLIRNETDLAVGPMALSEMSMHVSDNLQPLLSTNFQIFFKQHGTIVQWGAFLKPFDQLVWHAIALWLLLNSVILHFVYGLGSRYEHEPRTYMREYNKINAFLATLAAFCQQSSSRLPNSLPTRSIIFTGYLTSSVIFTAYSASLISKLTLEEPDRPFDSLHTFLADGTYTLLAIEKSIDYSYFSEGKDETLKAIYQKMMKHVPAAQLPDSKEAGLIDVCMKEKTAFYVTYAATHVAAKTIEKTHQCVILTFSKPITFAFLTILTQKYTPMTGILNRQLQKMVERGLLDRLKDKEWPLEEHVTSPTFEPVQLQQIIQITAILAVGMFLSLIILTIEVLISKSKIKINQHVINAIALVIYAIASVVALVTMFL